MSPDELEDISSRILYEDNHILIFNKVPGEIVQGDKTGDECLAETLKAFIAIRDSKPGKVFMGIPHRLDRPVSGIVVFAKTSKAVSSVFGSLYQTFPISKPPFKTLSISKRQQFMVSLLADIS